jgi:predicted transcriptional regulator of viral defense system
MAQNNIAKLLGLRDTFITLTTLQGMLNLTRASARTTASRFVRRGILTRVSRDLYVLAGKGYSLFSLANALYQPSVISLETALNYWGIIVQVPQIIFSTGLSSYQRQVDNTLFVYRRIDPVLFRFGQKRAEDFYVTEPEKALLDTLYMQSKGLTYLKPEDVDLDKLDKDLLDFYCHPYPTIVKKVVQLFMEQSYEAK